MSLRLAKIVMLVFCTVLGGSVSAAPTLQVEQFSKLLASFEDASDLPPSGIMRFAQPELGNVQIKFSARDRQLVRSLMVTDRFRSQEFPLTHLRFKVKIQDCRITESESVALH